MKDKEEEITDILEGANQDDAEPTSGAQTDADKESEAQPTEPDPKPVYEPKGPVNVVLAPSRNDDEALPPGICNIGPVSIEIPELEYQKDGFHVADPSVLVTQFPQYKYAKEKGDKNVPAI